MLAWHFCRNDSRLGFEDGRQIRIGRTLKVKPPVKFCEHGLHASKRIIDALDYAQGDVVCRVQLSGQIIKDNDKLVATERTVIAKANAEKLLREFACQCLKRALKKVKVIDKRCWGAIPMKTRQDWLKDLITTKQLATAWDIAAARDATWDATWVDAWADARADARAAARDDARDAVRIDAWVAAKAATWVDAWDVAWATERKWQNKILTKMVKTLLKIS